MSVSDVSRDSNLETNVSSSAAAPSINIHKQLGIGVEYILKNALLRRSLDNVTVVVIGFEGFQRKLQQGGGCHLDVVN